MSKNSYTLEQFKEHLESDATKRNAQQEQTIKELNRKIRTMQQEAEEKDKAIETLQNRCHVFTKGLMCVFCGFKRECKRGKETNTGAEGSDK